MRKGIVKGAFGLLLVLMLSMSTLLFVSAEDEDGADVKTAKDKDSPEVKEPTVQNLESLNDIGAKIELSQKSYVYSIRCKAGCQGSGWSKSNT